MFQDLSRISNISNIISCLYCYVCLFSSCTTIVCIWYIHYTTTSIPLHNISICWVSVRYNYYNHYIITTVFKITITSPLYTIYVYYTNYVDICVMTNHYINTTVLSPLYIILPHHIYIYIHILYFVKLYLVCIWLYITYITIISNTVLMPSGYL